MHGPDCITDRRGIIVHLIQRGPGGQVMFEWDDANGVQINKDKPDIPKECQECIYLEERGMDYPPLCDLIKNELGQPCASQFNAVMWNNQPPEHESCPWRQKIGQTSQTGCGCSRKITGTKE